MISAEEMRQITENNMSKVVKKELDWIQKGILQAAKDGRSSIEINGSDICTETKKALVVNGYDCGHSWGTFIVRW